MSFLEDVWISISDSNGIKVLLSCSCKRQNGSLSSNQLLVVKILYKLRVTIIFWRLVAVSGDDKQFIDTLGDGYMRQLVGRPTKFKQGQEPSLLDLVILNNQVLVSETVQDNPIQKSDKV